MKLQNYGTSGIQAFRELAEKNNVCVAREDSILTTADESAFDAVVQNLDQDRAANVVVCFCEGFTIRHLMEASKRMNLTGRFVFVGSDGWADRDDVVHDLENEAWGSLSVRIHSPYVSEFDSHYLALHPDNNARNPWFNEFWQHNFNCSLPQEVVAAAAADVVKDPATDAPLNFPNCTGEERLTQERYRQDPKMSFVMKSFWVMAHGLHNMLEDVCGHNYTGVCKEMIPFNGTRFRNHLMNVSFNFGEDVVEFDRRGDPPGRYEILNYQRMPNGSYAYVQIGEWNNGTLTLSGWPQSRTPNLVESVCSKPCPPGHYKNFKTGGQEKRCCWACVPCDRYEIANEEQSGCIPCPQGQLPNDNKTECYEMPLEFTQWRDVEAIISMTAASLGLLATLVTCFIFIRHNDTPVVKASTRELSYLILAGMSISHVSILAVLAEPTYISCILSRLMPGISFAMIYASLFTKTNRIARILAGSKKRFPKRKPLFMSATAQILITCTLIAIEIAVATAMLMLESAGPTVEYPTRQRAVLTCTTTARAVLYPLAFDGVLIILCTLYAIKTRNVPENFNEAKFIGFAMYTTCVIWVAFVPIYFGSETKVLTMCMCVTLSASVTLVFLFWPKLYIIVLRPDRNNRAFFTTSKSIRCHIGARVAAAIAEPQPKYGIYKISESDETESSSAYNRSTSSSVKRRTLSIQTDQELLLSLCQTLIKEKNIIPATTSENETKKKISTTTTTECEVEVTIRDKDKTATSSSSLNGNRRSSGGRRRESYAGSTNNTNNSGDNRVNSGGGSSSLAHKWAELSVRKLVDDLRRRSTTACPPLPSSQANGLHLGPTTTDLDSTNNSGGGCNGHSNGKFQPARSSNNNNATTRIREEFEPMPMNGADSALDPIYNITIKLAPQLPPTTTADYLETGSAV
ncbi:metabotropic glutamate receptor 1-like [Trichogramma pretiosum]|uniref:metabotropic glutamate receptor 1-like n=1 Tax=Trichogramma pretiosum TaxID=7493 RepID=UPI000C71C364|nr:metabotropic glutamate receptor 1-like [Trichogramma pretiosum]